MTIFKNLMNMKIIENELIQNRTIQVRVEYSVQTIIVKMLSCEE